MATNDKFKSKVVAKIKGDDAEVQAAKIESRAKAAITGQIAALNSKKVEAGIKLDDAKTALEDAIFPVSLTNGESYVYAIKTAQAAVDTAEDGVDAIKESIAYYESLLAETFGA